MASVKALSAGANEGQWRGRENISKSPASLTMQNVRLRSAMAWAYEVQGPQIVGPEQLDSERYDIFARAAGAVEEGQLRSMLQRLLADRFRLTLRRSTREMIAYVLQVAKGGPKLPESAADGENDVTSTAKMTATARKTTVAQFAAHLADEFHAPVVDTTGLKGEFDFVLNIAPYITPESKSEDIPGIAAQAIEQQLGLKLESRRTPIEVLMVEHLEKAPVEN